MKAKPTHLAVPNHMMRDKTPRHPLPSPSPVNNRLHVVSTLPIKCNHTNSFSIPVTLCIHHLSHRSLSLKITRNIPHVTRSTDSPHSLSIAFVLYYSSLYQSVHISFLVDRLARYVWFLASVCPRPLTNRTTFTVPTLIQLSAHLSHIPSRQCCSIPRIPYPIEQCFYNTVSAITRANYRVWCVPWQI